MDINAVMLRAAGALNAIADTCQYLPQKEELRQRAHELLAARTCLALQVNDVVSAEIKLRACQGIRIRGKELREESLQGLHRAVDRLKESANG